MSSQYLLYLSGLLFAAQIVVGNALYKVAVERSDFALSAEFFFSKKMLGLLSSPVFLAGLAFFLASTAISFWMFTKWDFNAIQVVTVPIVLIFSLLVGWRFFDESITLINAIGLGVIVFGVFLATIK